MRIVLATVVLVLSAVASVPGSDRAPRFYDDDPVWLQLDTQDASKVAQWDIDLAVDMLENLFGRPGDPRPVAAGNVNTVGEVPDSSWFTNRAGVWPLSADEMRRGPNRTAGPASGTWTIISAKADGIMPGCVIRDAQGVVWFIKFDPPEYPRMASGAEVVTTKLLWALGYNVPENHVAIVRPEQLELAPEATVRMPNGKRPMRSGDVATMLQRAARAPDGSHRVLASRRIDGTPLGGFRFYGTRSDDPNDYVAHEHRRELRGYGTFAAWLNHVDSKSINTFDVLVANGGARLVQHYLLDFGSTLGSAGIQPREPFEGTEYLFEGRSTVAGLASLGLRVPPWRTTAVVVHPAVGALPDASGWDPETWKPRIPNPAFVRAQLEDKFWAARKLQALTRELLEAAVSSAQYGDAEADRLVLEFVLDRRRAILARYLPAINPVVEPVLTASGLRFVNAAVEADVAARPRGYRVFWAWYDNSTDSVTTFAETTSRTTEVEAPQTLARPAAYFVRAAIVAEGGLPAWSQPVHAYFRHCADRWVLVGLERSPAAEPIPATR